MLRITHLSGLVALLILALSYASSQAQAQYRDSQGRWHPAPKPKPQGTWKNESLCVRICGGSRATWKCVDDCMYGKHQLQR